MTAIENGDITKTLNPDMQKPHIFGSNMYNPNEKKSYFTISLEEIQMLVDNYYGTGYIIIKASGQTKEVINLPNDVAKCVGENGEDLGSTNKITIHYSKKRTHVVPAEKE